MIPVLLLLGTLLVGCGSVITPVVGDPVPPGVPGPVAGTYNGAGFTGNVFAGDVPIVGSVLQLYAAGTSGNGVAAGVLITMTVISDSAGLFKIPANYSCPLSTTQLYLVARGGRPAAPSAQENTAIGLLAALGSCNAISATSRVVINEVTTASAAWALSQFSGSSAVIGASSTNARGLANAFQQSAALALTVTGPSSSNTAPNSVSLPLSRINSLANLLNTCTRSVPSATTSTSCAELFTAATVSGSAAPENTLDAAFAVTRNPASNVTSLYNLSRTSSAFEPALTSAPADWTLSLVISGGGMAGPATVALLSTGSVWVSNYFDVASAFSPLGAPVFPTGITGSGLDHSYGMAVDASDDAWIGNEDKSTVTELASSGSSLSGAGGFAQGGIDFPIALAIDPDDSVWVVDYGNSHISRLSTTGASLSGATGYASSQIAFPVAIAVDASHNGWIANSQGTTITRLSQDGATVASAVCCDGPDGIAIDQRGYVWVSNFYGNSVSQVSSSLAVVSSGYKASAISRPQGIAIDGIGNVWVVSFRAAGIVELAGSQTMNPGALLSPSSGWAADSPLLEAYSLAIDASGNIWIANFGSSTLTKVIGLAAPIKTPSLGPVQAP